MAGIITELMFYANYCRDMYADQHNSWKPVRHTPQMKDHRGYKLLSDACYGEKPMQIQQVNAHMLVDTQGLHPLISKEVLDEMCNGGEEGTIRYRVLQYDGTTGAIVRTED